jgi:hypothetical protein
LQASNNAFKLHAEQQELGQRQLIEVFQSNESALQAAQEEIDNLKTAAPGSNSTQMTDLQTTLTASDQHVTTLTEERDALLQYAQQLEEELSEANCDRGLCRMVFHVHKVQVLTLQSALCHWRHVCSAPLR